MSRYPFHRGAGSVDIGVCDTCLVLPSTEVLGALISVFVIWVVTAVLVYVAVERIVHEHYKDVKADEMLITAVLGVIFNVVYVRLLCVLLLTVKIDLRYQASYIFLNTVFINQNCFQSKISIINL